MLLDFPVTDRIEGTCLGTAVAEQAFRGVDRAYRRSFFREFINCPGRTYAFATPATGAALLINGKTEACFSRAAFEDRAERTKDRVPPPFLEKEAAEDSDAG